MISAIGAACAGSWYWAKSTKTITGKLLGSSMGLGHALRDKSNFSAAEGRTIHAKVVIVGGGISGLSAAYHLQKSEMKDFVLLELEDSVGGNSVSGSNEVSAYPWGGALCTVTWTRS